MSATPCLNCLHYGCEHICKDCDGEMYSAGTPRMDAQQAAHAAEVERLTASRDTAVRERDAAVEALRSIKNGEVEVFDESEGCLVCVGMDEEEMQEIACAVLTKIEGGRNGQDV